MATAYYSSGSVPGSFCHICQRTVTDEGRHVIAEHMDQHRYHCRTHLFRTNDETDFTDHRLKMTGCEATDRLLDAQYFEDIQSNRRVCFPPGSSAPTVEPPSSNSSTSTPAVSKSPQQNSQSSIFKTLPPLHPKHEAGEIPEPTYSIHQSNGANDFAVTVNQMLPNVVKEEKKSFQTKIAGIAPFGLTTTSFYECRQCQRPVSVKILVHHAMEHETKSDPRVNYYLCPETGCEFGAKARNVVEFHLRTMHPESLHQNAQCCKDRFGKGFLSELRRKYFGNIPSKKVRQAFRRKLQSLDVIHRAKRRPPQDPNKPRVRQIRTHCKICLKEIDEGTKGFGFLSHILREHDMGIFPYYCKMCPFGARYNQTVWGHVKQVHELYDARSAIVNAWDKFPERRSELMEIAERGVEPAVVQLMATLLDKPDEPGQQPAEAEHFADSTGAEGFADSSGAEGFADSFGLMEGQVDDAIEDEEMGDENGEVQSDDLIGWSQSPSALEVEQDDEEEDVREGKSY